MDVLQRHFADGFGCVTDWFGCVAEEVVAYEFVAKVVRQCS